jgi:cell division protein FtsA
VASPFASALAVLTDDEAELGTVVIDMGAGTSTVAVFSGNQFVHADGIALGGHHVTMDVARGLSTGLSVAERLKVLHGAAFSCKSDERDMIAVPHMGEDDRDAVEHISRASMIGIIRPRVDEILEMLRDRLYAAGVAGEAGRRVVLTGGASQLPGLADRAAHILGRQVRIGRPVGMTGLPDIGKGPSFAAAVGLTVYPQIAGLEHFEPRRSFFGEGQSESYFAQVGRWLKQSF